MRDLVFFTVTVGFFSLAALVVATCDRIVGAEPADPSAAGGTTTPAETEQMAR